MRFVMTTAVMIAALGLGGCVTQQGLYKWGGYDNMLYAGYKDPTQMEAMRVKLESHIGEMEKGGQKVAPGLYAELGTLYLQSGDATKATTLYARERDTWPESKGLMDSLIQSIGRRQQQAKAETTK
ncbi:MAG TPA: DUF4810 domain-containing protein [Rhodocyclaceae bacterium]|nr:DUF4810 domain-containing protein [Rhodocyclaceae bacterium]